MEPGDIAFKCNFAALDTSSGIVISRRADRKFEDIGPRLCADLNGVVLFCCHCPSIWMRVRKGLNDVLLLSPQHQNMGQG